LREGHLASGYSQPAVKYSLVDIDAKWCEDPAKRRQDKGYNDHQGSFSVDNADEVPVSCEDALQSVSISFPVKLRT